jgi:predicted metal-dependent enzyme (double-stranded beta helix superfamily)
MAPTDTLKPQDWTEVVSPPAELLAAIRELVPAGDGPLTTEQLVRLSAEIAAHEELWRPLVVADPDRCRYRLLYEDDRVDSWLIMWMPGQGTGFHDHAISGVGLVGVDGAVTEKQMRLPSGSFDVEVRNGDTREGPAGYIHSVAHLEGTPAITIHSYSPPLMEVAQYRVDENGVLRRETEHGRRELIDNTIAEVAPDLG